MKRYHKNVLRVLSFLIVIMLILGGIYTSWNAANPERTCTKCHEIVASHETWTASAHRNIACFKCHGTALDNGWHSLKEKSKMAFTHFGKPIRSDNIRLSEAQILETMERCSGCHQTEYASWKASGHSATYEAIFLDKTHNSAEQPNFDCLRCHGMFYEGTILDVVEPIDTTGPWSLKDKNLEGKPTIPCLTCHRIHSTGIPAKEPDYSKPNNIFYSRNIQNNSIGFYSRHEKTHFLIDQLPRPVMLHKGDTISTPVDPVYRLCVQCHAPSVWHEVGSSDDHTPVGVHQGLSCRSCHERHSNDQRNSCDKCHPAISNCRIDVKTMNTTYFSPSSPNDIHFVKCEDCHKNKPKVR